jgi:hypothetical protein
MIRIINSRLVTTSKKLMTAWIISQTRKTGEFFFISVKLLFLSVPKHRRESLYRALCEEAGYAADCISEASF